MISTCIKYGEQCVKIEKNKIKCRFVQILNELGKNKEIKMKDSERKAYKKLVKMCIIKQVINPGVEYVTKEDLEELKGFDCEWIVLQIKKEIEEGLNIDDSYTCPWCWHFLGDCKDCTYGKRHGVCGTGDTNTYSYFIGDQPSAIEYPGIIEKLKMLFNIK